MLQLSPLAIAEPMARQYNRVCFRSQAETPGNITPAGSATSVKPSPNPIKSWLSHFAPMQRLGNGCVEVIRLFMPTHLGETVKRVLISTVVLTIFSAFMGPFAPLVGLGASLSWEVVGAFIGGAWRNPHAPQQAFD